MSITLLNAKDCAETTANNVSYKINNETTLDPAVTTFHIAKPILPLTLLN